MNFFIWKRMMYAFAVRNYALVFLHFPKYLYVCPPLAKASDMRGPDSGHMSPLESRMGGKSESRCKCLLYSNLPRNSRHIQGSTKRPLPGLVNLVPAVANHFCLNLPAALLQPWNGLIVLPCRMRLGGQLSDCVVRNSFFK